MYERMVRYRGPRTNKSSGNVNIALQAVGNVNIAIQVLPRLGRHYTWGSLNSLNHELSENTLVSRIRQKMR